MLAFAVDVVILADSRKKIEEITKVLIREIQVVGLKINGKKKLVHFSLINDSWNLSPRPQI